MPKISQIELITAICTELDRQGLKSLHAHQYNAIIAAANELIRELIRELKRPPKMAEANMGLQDWLASDDTGLSSRYMASILSGGLDTNYAHPHDVGDFGRCSRLLLAVPEFRDRLPMMSDKGHAWAALVRDWESIESLIQQDKIAEANAMIQADVRPS